MKKTLLALAIGALAVSSAANANWYVDADAGLSKFKADESSKTSFVPSLAVGYRFGDFRLALDYTHYGKIVDVSESGVGNYADTAGQLVALPVYDTYTVKAYSVGASAIYDFKINNETTAFAGARLSQNAFKVNSTTVIGGNRANVANLDESFESSTQSKLGYGVLAGAAYNVTKNIAVIGAVEWNHLGKFGDEKLSQYGAKAGIRYEF